MSKHTPGPWEHKKDGDEWRIRQKGSVKKVFGGTTERPVCEVVNSLADARLIAAAPELLEALSGMLERYTELVNCGDCGNWDAEQEKEVVASRAAIAKAKGIKA